MPESMVCPKGQILRKGYKRVYNNSVIKRGFTVRRKGKVFVAHPPSSTITVEASCIKDRRETRKGKDKTTILPKGTLISHGYQYRLADSKRHTALKKVLKYHAPRRVYDTLQHISRASVKTAPDASAIIAKDRNWIRDMYKK